MLEKWFHHFSNTPLSIYVRPNLQKCRIISYRFICFYSAWELGWWLKAAEWKN